MEGGPFSKWGSRLGAAHIVFKVCNNYTDGGRPFSKWGSRLGAAHIRLKSLQQFHGWRAGRFQNGALTLAPRTFVLNKHSNKKYGLTVARFQNKALAFSLPHQCQAHGAPVRPMGRPSYKGARPGVKGNACMDL